MNGNQLISPTLRSLTSLLTLAMFPQFQRSQRRRKPKLWRRPQQSRPLWPKYSLKNHRRTLGNPQTFLTLPYLTNLKTWMRFLWQKTHQQQQQLKQRPRRKLQILSQPSLQLSLRSKVKKLVRIMKICRVENKTKRSPRTNQVKSPTPQWMKSPWFRMSQKKQEKTNQRKAPPKQQWQQSSLKLLHRQRRSKDPKNKKNPGNSRL